MYNKNKRVNIKKYVRLLHKIKDPYCSEEEIKSYVKDWKQRSEILFKWLKNVPKKSKILDCGCGVGISGAILKEKGFVDIVGIEINNRNINAAKTFFKVYKMDCENIRFKPKSFDIVLALNIIEHLNKPKLFVQKIRKILKTDGLIVFSLPNEIWFRKMLGLIPKESEHKQSWSFISFKNFLNKNGFKVLDTKPTGNIPFLFACQTFMVLARVRK